MQKSDIRWKHLYKILLNFSKYIQNAKPLTFLRQWISNRFDLIQLEVLNPLQLLCYSKIVHDLNACCRQFKHFISQKIEVSLRPFSSVRLCRSDPLFKRLLSSFFGSKESNVEYHLIPQEQETSEEKMNILTETKKKH